MPTVDLHSHVFPFQLTHDVLERSAEELGRDGVALSDPSLHVDDDLLVEWYDLGREVAVQLTENLDVLSRNTLVAQGFDNRFCLNGVEGFLQVDERET